MEVRDQGVDDAEAIAGRNEQPCLAAIVAGRRGGLERPHHRRAHGHHAAIAFVDGAACRRGYGVALGMHLVPAQVVLADRLKSTCAHMQGDGCNTHALGAQAIQKIVVEVQARRRCRHGTGHPRIDGLVAVLVLGIGRAPDVWRQRYLAVRVQVLGDGRVEVEQMELAVPIHDVDSVPVPVQGPVRLQRLADAHLAKRPVRVQDPLDKHLRPPAGVLPRHQPRLDHPAVVDDEQIVGAEQVRQVDEPAVTYRIAGERQQAAGGTRRERTLGDQRLRQVEAKVGATH